MERFLASLVEHYGGAFPVWLAPLQVAIIPVADRHLDYARQLEGELKDLGVRAETDARAETVNMKIRQAQLNKVPYMLVVGDKEIAGQMMSIRVRGEEHLLMKPFADFKAGIKMKITSRTTDLELP
jgi:threonyl-tRNA synthetase